MENKEQFSGCTIFHQDGRIEEQVLKNGKFFSSTVKQVMPNGAYVTTTFSIGKPFKIVCS